MSMIVCLFPKLPYFVRWFVRLLARSFVSASIPICICICSRHGYDVSRAPYLRISPQSFLCGLSTARVCFRFLLSAAVPPPIHLP